MEVFVFLSTSLCSIIYSWCWRYNKLCYTADFIPSVATGSGKVYVFSLASGSPEEPNINNHNIALFLLVFSKFGLVQPEPKVTVDNHQDPRNPLWQLPRWPVTILYSNLQSRRKAAFHPHPSAQTLRVNFQWSPTTARLSWKKKETHAKQSVPW